MSINIIDKRTVNRDRTTENRQRFLKRIKATIKEQLPKIIGGRSLKDIDKSGGQIKVKRKTINEPFIHHGSGGNNTSLNYLVADLTSKGIIIVATNYLSDDENIYPPETISIKPWIQNADSSFLLDQVLKEKKFINNISKDSIGILGYSKGGYSALALAGGKLDYNKTYLNNFGYQNCKNYFSRIVYI